MYLHTRHKHLAHTHIQSHMRTRPSSASQARIFPSTRRMSIRVRLPSLSLEGDPLLSLSNNLEHLAPEVMAGVCECGGSLVGCCEINTLIHLASRDRALCSCCPHPHPPQVINGFRLAVDRQLAAQE